MQIDEEFFVFEIKTNNYNSYISAYLMRLTVCV